MKSQTIKILFIGDIFGRPGRNAVKQMLPKIKQEESVDFVIANGENLAAGKGMTYAKYEEMIEAGIDYFTSGNHIWKNADIIPYLEKKSIKVLRPINYPDNPVGEGFVKLKIKNTDFVIANALGRVFINELLLDPFSMLKELAQTEKDSVILIDFHAEATSEKVALGHYLDGEVGAVLGTHTHIQTADERVLPGGTGYITDVGMCGPKESVIGVKKEIIIEQFLTAMPQSHKVAVGETIFNAVLLEIDPITKKAIKLKRYNKTLSESGEEVKDE